MSRYPCYKAFLCPFGTQHEALPNYLWASSTFDVEWSQEGELVVGIGPLSPCPGAFVKSAWVPDSFIRARRALRHVGLPVMLGISEVLVMDHLHAGPGRVLGPCLSRQVPSVFSWNLWSSGEQTLNKLL